MVLYSMGSMSSRSGVTRHTNCSTRVYSANSSVWRRLSSNPIISRICGCIAVAEHTWITRPAIGRIASQSGNRAGRKAVGSSSVGSGRRINPANWSRRKPLDCNLFSTMSS
ncbi:Uncharacterised protein [Mycobacteroides abscessus subsp. abscessus]|nr:Uncharacterised protein [Mycobacteroides abscessus subsp. abscessus]